MSFCAPSRKHLEQDFTCFDRPELVAIAQTYNQRVSKSQQISFNQKTSLKDLHSKIFAKFSNFCSNESCWLDLNIISLIPDQELRNQITHFALKPKMTEHIDSWLTTLDINAILYQQEKLVSENYKYLGAYPSDIYEISKTFRQELDLNLKNTNYLGIVLNTDPHTAPGKHWTALFIDTDSQIVDFFDSAGNPPNKKVAKFIKCVFKNNRVAYQKGDTMCGIFCCYYLIKKTTGDFKGKITDQSMRRFKKTLTRPRHP
jgi:hypothetical protein